MEVSMVNAVWSDDKKTKRKENWTDGEVKVLIQSWQDNLEDLRKLKRNRLVYEKMSGDLIEMGHSRDWISIQRKVKNLTREFREEKKKVERSRQRSNWKYFDKINRFFDSMPENTESLMVESSVDTGNESLAVLLNPTTVPLPSQSEDEDDVLNYLETPGPGLLSTTPCTSSSTSSSEFEPGVNQGETLKKKFIARRTRNKKSSAENNLISKFLTELRASHEETKINDKEIIDILKKQNELHAESIQLQREFIKVVGNFLNKQ